MKKMLKGYLLYLAGALCVLAWAWWSYTQASGENLTAFLVRARAQTNGHVPDGHLSAVED